MQTLIWCIELVHVLLLIIVHMYIVDVIFGFADSMCSLVTIYLPRIQLKHNLV